MGVAHIALRKYPGLLAALKPARPCPTVKEEKVEEG